VRKREMKKKRQKNNKKRTEPLLVPRLCHPAIEPVDDVKGSIRTQQENVVPGQVVDVARPLQQDELGQDRDRLEQDREGPRVFHQGFPIRRKGPGQQCRWNDQKRDSESVVCLVVGLLDPLGDSHQVEDCRRRSQEDELHQRVVEGDVAVFVDDCFLG